ncbi:MAG: DNA-processing protein DprA, partial [Patescibacteria group bacterium]
MEKSDLKYWLALVRVPFFGAVRIGKLFRAFPNMERAFCASQSELLEAEIEPEIVNRFLQGRYHLDPDRELEKLHTAGLNVLTCKDDLYPTLLSHIENPPVLLFYRGIIPDQTRKHIAVVGSREVTAYGTRAIEHIVEPLAKSGVVIVSGLAYGVDALAHQTTLKHGGTTIAVLGTGADEASLYPATNRHLASQIVAKGGAIISEF